MLKLQKVYLVTYLASRGSTVCSYHLAFLEDFSHEHYEKRRRYFKYEEDAEKFLEVYKKFFRVSCPEYKDLVNDKNFKMQTKLRLVRSR